MLTLCAVHPNDRGLYRHEITSEGRIPVGAELYLHPAPDQVAESRMRPTYYVRHPDDSYTVADPQPGEQGVKVHQLSELGMHRAAHQMCKAAGFENPEELLSAYKTQGAEIERLKADLVLRDATVSSLSAKAISDDLAYIAIHEERDTLREQVRVLSEALTETEQALIEGGGEGHPWIPGCAAKAVLTSVQAALAAVKGGQA